MVVINYKTQPTEILLNNFVDEDFQNMLLPLNVMQLMYFNPKFSIKYNFVTPNQLTQKLIALLGFILYATFYIYRLYVVNYGKYNLIYNYADFAFYAIGFAMNFICCISQSNLNINLIMMLHEIYNQLNIKVKLRYFAIWNWMYLISIFLTYLINMCYLFFAKNVTLISVFMQLVGNFLLMSIDINAIYAIRILDLTKTELEIWNIEVESSDTTATELTSYECCNYWNKMFKMYKTIQEAFIILKKVCQTQILYHVCESLFHALLYLKLVLEYNNNNRLSELQMIYSYICIGIWVIKNFTLHSLLSRECEKFYMEMKKAEHICAKMLIRDGCQGAKRIMCKNIPRLNKSLDYKFNVHGFFVIDAKFPQSFMDLLATYAIVLLQFEINT